MNRLITVAIQCGYNNQTSDVVGEVNCFCANSQASFDAEIDQRIISCHLMWVLCARICSSKGAQFACPEAVSALERPMRSRVAGGEFVLGAYLAQANLLAQIGH